MCAFCGLTDSLAALFSGLGYILLMVGQSILAIIFFSIQTLFKKLTK